MGIEKNGVMFYNEKSEKFDETKQKKMSLLEYIDSQNVRFTREREELVDLAVLIARLNNSKSDYKSEEGYKTEVKDAMEEVTNHFKSELPSGEGLRDMLVMIGERFPWSSSKTSIKSLISFLFCVLGIGLYVLDIYTDVKFSIDMFIRMGILYF